MLYIYIDAHINVVNQVDIKIGIKGIELQNPVGKAIATELMQMR